MHASRNPLTFYWDVKQTSEFICSYLNRLIEESDSKILIIFLIGVYQNVKKNSGVKTDKISLCLTPSYGPTVYDTKLILLKI